MECVYDLEHLARVYEPGMPVSFDGTDFDNTGHWPSTAEVAQEHYGPNEMCLLLDDRYAVNLADLCAWVSAKHPIVRLFVFPSTAPSPGHLGALAAEWGLREDWHAPQDADVSAHWRDTPQQRFTLARQERTAEDTLVDVIVDDLLRWATAERHGTLAGPTTSRSSHLDTLLLGPRLLA